MKWLQAHGNNRGDLTRLGPVLYVAGMQYFAVQLLAALRWPRPYNISRDTISDLGNTACGTWNGRYVCSPLHDLMNGSFIVLGITMLLGSVLISQRYGKGRIAMTGFTAIGLSGLGVVMVGVLQECGFVFLSPCRGSTTRPGGLRQQPLSRARRRRDRTGRSLSSDHLPCGDRLLPDRGFSVRPVTNGPPHHAPG